MNNKLFGIDCFGLKKESRLNPKIFQCWYLHLKALEKTIEDWCFILPANRNGILLDIGSGDNPPYFSLLSAKVGKIITLDPFSNKVDVRTPAENIPLANDSIDYVFSSQTLEHTKNPFLVANEIRRVLKNGGIAFISTHGLWEIHRVPKDYWRFTPDGFFELFKDFSEVSIKPNGGTVLCIGQLFNLSLTPVFTKTPLLKLPVIFVWFVVNIFVLFLDKWIDDKRLVINYSVMLKK